MFWKNVQPAAGMCFILALLIEVIFFFDDDGLKQKIYSLYILHNSLAALLFGYSFVALECDWGLMQSTNIEW